MLLNRRDFVKRAAIAAAALPAWTPIRARGESALPIRVGMTDWNLGQRGDVTEIALARQIGLDGIQVSLSYPADGGLHLRDPRVQAQFKQAALEHGVQICSLAIGNPGKSRLPLHTSPTAAILLVEAIEAARN